MRTDNRPSKTSNPDRRLAPRAALSCLVVAEQDARSVRCVCIDVSRSGMRLEGFDRQVWLGEPVVLRFDPEDGHGEVVCEARIVTRHESGEMGVAFMGRMRLPERRWLVFGPDGAVRAEVRTPDGFRPLAIRSDRVWGIYTDDFDVESVRAYGIRR